MLEINFSNVTKTFGYDKKVLNNFSFELLTNEKIALVGPNGSGKTTIFKIIMGEENINSGDVSIRNGATIGFLSQMPVEVDDSVTLKDVLIRHVKEVFEIEKELRELELQMAQEKDLTKVLKKYSRLQAQFEILNGYEIESKISKICNGFKLKELDRIYNTLSGGEKTITNLASLILSEPSILLLDEPTNHLDIETLEWFENYLKEYRGAVIISSHDRYFLDRVVEKIVLIDRGETEIFHGNYTYFLKENEKRIMIEFENFKTQAKQIDAMKAKIKQLQEWGKLAHPNGEGFFKRAASIQKRLDKIEILEKPEEKKELPIDFKINNRSGKDVIVIENFNLSIADNNLINNINIKVNYQEKICLMGANGSGKSTLIKEILSKNPELKVGSNVEIGYIPQEIIFDDNQETILSYARKISNKEESTLRSALHKFMFYGESVFKRVGNLSGGEKVRLKLFELIQKNANLLILDEPTNHIDIDTKEILEEALNDYTGTILFISHDRYFINKIANKVLYIENKEIKQYLGNYDFYKEHKK